jgi:thiamine biosynthesis lipoprotein
VGIRVERVMGTVVSVDVRDPDPGGQAGAAIATAVEAIIAWLHEVDARFSPFRSDSEIRRLDRGSLLLDDCHPDVRHVLRACEDLRRETDGAFDVRGHRADGALDPSGFVKGWAVDEAADILTAAGARSFAINAGGDIVARGEPAPGRPWRIGVRAPADVGRVAALLTVTGGAVATSGLYERGAHIRDPRSGSGSGSAPGAYASVTVVGPTLGLADAWATAAFALGEAGPAAVAARPGLGVLAIDPAGVATWSHLMTTLLA